MNTYIQRRKAFEKIGFSLNLLLRLRTISDSVFAFTRLKYAKRLKPILQAKMKQGTRFVEILFPSFCLQ